MLCSTGISDPSPPLLPSNTRAMSQMAQNLLQFSHVCHLQATSVTASLCDVSSSSSPQSSAFFFSLSITSFYLHSVVFYLSFLICCLHPFPLLTLSSLLAALVHSPSPTTVSLTFFFPSFSSLLSSCAVTPRPSFLRHPSLPPSCLSPEERLQRRGRAPPVGRSAFKDAIHPQFIPTALRRWAGTRGGDGEEEEEEDEQEEEEEEGAAVIFSSHSQERARFFPREQAGVADREGPSAGGVYGPVRPGCGRTPALLLLLLRDTGADPSPAIDEGAVLEEQRQKLRKGKREGKEEEEEEEEEEDLVAAG
ncbi:unnamed protein product [Pleuronectes platessa]|uniref:Uncharacterized protein n=1 Tax=Pleuronectes platessa TaxID=8262 RepID=A0A9N7TJI3_PLEPL|nr:unnamed protein product [Pleuronectes platessa]